MGTTSEKLAYLNETKAAIKSALIEQEQAVEDTDTFRSYADKVRSISRGIQAEVLEEVPISLDFTDGNQTVSVPEGMLVKSAVIQKPENLIPENIAKDVNIAGIVGTHEGSGSTEIVILAEQTFEGFSGGEFYLWDFLLDLEENETYRVVWDGVEYERTAYRFTMPSNGNSAIVVGNAVSVGGNDTGEPFMIATMPTSKIGLLVSMDYDATSHTVAIYQIRSGCNQPQLNAPSLSRSGTTVTISNPASNGGFVTAYNIYYGDTLLASQTDKTLDISGLDFGKHLLTATASGENFIDSEASAVLNASKYSVSLALTNVTSDVSPTYAWYGDALTIKLTGTDGYSVPNTITATMGGAVGGITFADGVISIASVTGDISITVVGKLPSLADDSWKTIAERANAGTASNYYSVGEEKTLTLNHTDGTSETVTVVLAAFNSETLSSGATTANMTFVTKELLATSRAYCDSFTNGTNYYNGSLIRTWLNGDLVSALPVEIQDNIKTVNKHTMRSSSHLFINKDKCWLLSLTEIGMSVADNYGTTYPCTNYDTHYAQVFPDKTSHTKYKVGATSASGWWLRDYHNAGAAGVLPVYARAEYYEEKGYGTSGFENNAYGVCFGFCL